MTKASAPNARPFKLNDAGELLNGTGEIRGFGCFCVGASEEAAEGGAEDGARRIAYDMPHSETIDTDDPPVRWNSLSDLPLAHALAYRRRACPHE